MERDTTMGGGEVRFQSTLWTAVREARSGSREALDQLCALYWKPVYFFIRRRGRDVEAAKDLTQSFFAAILEREFLERASPERGRFRSFLLASLVNFLCDEHDKATAKKRGGGFDFVRAEQQLASADPSPERAFQRQWALDVIERAMERLRGIVGADDLALLSGGGPGDGRTNDERKYKHRRLRQKLRECVMVELEPTVSGGEALEAEVRDLFAALA